MSEPIVTVSKPPDDQLYHCPNDLVSVAGVCRQPDAINAQFLRAEFDVIDNPAGAVSSFTPAVHTALLPQFDSDFEADQNGNYDIRVSCFFTSGYLEGPTPAGLTRDYDLACPAGAQAGSTFAITSFGFEPFETYTWTYTWALSGTFLLYAETSPGNLIATTTSTGAATIELTAVAIDGNGNPHPDGPVVIECVTTIFSTEDLATSIETRSDPFIVDVVDCGEICFNSETTITINCNEDEECQTITIDLQPYESNVVAAPEVCPPAVPVPIVGLAQYFPLPTYELECEPCGDDVYIPEPIDQDRPAIIWNDCARCPDWAVQGDAANAANCIVGRPWCFTGVGEYTVSGPGECSADIAVIYGHNIQSATITSSAPLFGGPRTFNVCEDLAKIGGYTRPLVIPFAGLTTAGSHSLFIDGVGIGGQPICIDYIIIGQKLFIPGDCLSADFVNPLDGSDTVSKIKRSNCAILSEEITQVEVPWSVTIDAPQTWIELEWRSLMRYLDNGNPFVFQPSRNNAEQDLLLGRKTKTQSGSSYISCNYLSVTISVEGFIRQQQPKVFE